MRDGDDRDRTRHVVVPHRPGPLVSLDAEPDGRERDDLDELIDDLFPDVEERPGWFDAALGVSGAALLTWAWLADLPGVVVAIGIAALALGCILPIRAGWRRLRRRRSQHHRDALLERGMPLDVSSPEVAALVAAYDELLGLARRSAWDLADTAVAAAHGALLEVGSLLQGRPPASGRELAYVSARTSAIGELVGALPADDQPSVDADALVEAREELDRLAPMTAVTRLEELTAEARKRAGGG